MCQPSTSYSPSSAHNPETASASPASTSGPYEAIRRPMASSSSTRRSRCSSAASRSSTIIGIPLRVQQPLHGAMCAENRLGPIGIVAHGDDLLVAADDVYGTTAQPLQSLAGHTGGLGDDEAGCVEIQADPVHRGCARHAQYQVQHVDAVPPELQP